MTYHARRETVVTRSAYDAALREAERAQRLAAEVELLRARVEALTTVLAAMQELALQLPGGPEAVAAMVARVAKVQR